MKHLFLMTLLVLWSCSTDNTDDLLKGNPVSMATRTNRST